MVVIHRIIIRCRTIFDPSLRKLASQPKAFFALVLFKTNKKTKKNDLSLQKRRQRGGTRFDWGKSGNDHPLGNLFSTEIHAHGLGSLFLTKKSQ